METTSAVPDLLSFDSWQSMSAGTVSTQSSFAGGGDSTPLPPLVGATIPQPNIDVSISGVRFSLDQSTFEKLRQLPWQLEQGAFSNQVSYSLSTSPELFDILVHHVLFGALPHAMTEHDIEELEVMALSLGLLDLSNHLSVMQPLPRRKLQKQASLTKLSKASSLRSLAALKRWSSVGRLMVKERLMETKKTNKWPVPGESSGMASQRGAAAAVHMHAASATMDLA